MATASTNDEKDSPAALLLSGARRAAIDSCVYLPDSCLTPTIRIFQKCPEIRMIPCSREDEGVAIAVGLHLAGRRAICMMEASGIGYSGLILARAVAQRTPVIILASHSGGGGEPQDYHGATCLVAEGIFTGLGIGYEVASDAKTLDAAIYRVAETAFGQFRSFGLLAPPYTLLRGAR